MKISDIAEGVAGPKNCWPGHRKVGTQPGTGKNAGKRVNKCKKIGEDVATVDTGEYDREGDMAKSQLTTAADAANELRSILDSDENLPEWVQAKITKAVDYLDTARDYMKSKEQGVAEQLDEVSPKGWEGTVKAMKKHKEIDNPWALAWYMKNKGYKSHKKESIDPDQRKAKQVPGEEMPKSTGPILGKEPKQHPFKGRSVGGGV